MKFNILIIVLFISSCSCNDENVAESNPKKMEPETETLFDSQKWNTKKGASYPFREKMLNHIIYNDSLRTLKRKDVIAYLGEPTRVNNEYVYYLIEKNKALFMTLNSKTLVIKFKEDEMVEWMKIHE